MMGAYSISKVITELISSERVLIADGIQLQAGLNMCAANFSNELYDEGFCCIAQDPG